MSVVTLAYINGSVGNMDWNKKSEAFHRSVARGETNFHPYDPERTTSNEVTRRPSTSSLARRTSASSISSHGSGGGKLRPTFSSNSRSKMLYGVGGRAAHAGSMSMCNFNLSRNSTRKKRSSQELRLSRNNSRSSINNGSSNHLVTLRASSQSTPVIDRGGLRAHSASKSSTKNEDWGEIMSPPSGLVLSQRNVKNVFARLTPPQETFMSATPKKNPFTETHIRKRLATPQQNVFAKLTTAQEDIPTMATIAMPVPRKNTPAVVTSGIMNPLSSQATEATPRRMNPLMEVVAPPLIESVSPLMNPLTATHDEAPCLKLAKRMEGNVDTVHKNNLYRGAPPPTFSHSCVYPTEITPRLPKPASLTGSDIFAKLDEISRGYIDDDISLAGSDEISKTTSDTAPEVSKDTSTAANMNELPKWSEYLSPTTLIGSLSSFLPKNTPSLYNSIKQKSSMLLSPAIPETIPMEIPKKVGFSIMEDVIAYETTPEDTKKSWNVLKVPTTLRNIEMISRHRGISVSYSEAANTPGKTCMVHIEPKPLIDEILKMTERHRRAVLDEQDRQRKEGDEDVEKLGEVAAEHSRWGVGLASSNWWLER